jgi:hypothetical protein
MDKVLLYKKALERKLNKIKKRLNLINDYVSDEQSKKMSFANWLKNVKGINIFDFFTSIGYKPFQDKAISDDSENKSIKSAKDFMLNQIKGYPILVQEEKSGIDGMVFNEHTQRYYPIADSFRYQQELANQQPTLNDIEGISLNEIGDLDISNSTNKYKLYWLKEALGSEYDNLDGEYSNFIENDFDYQKNKQLRDRRIDERMFMIRLDGNPF